MSTVTGYKCEVCGVELPYSGRGRPPKRCAEHKRTQMPENGKPEQQGEKENMATQTRPRPGQQSRQEDSPRPRPRPGQRAETDSPLADVPPADFIREGQSSLGKSDTGSRAKAENAAKQAQAQQISETVPVNRNGKPLAKIVFSAAELVPTGQYANVSIGPVQVTAWIDLDREIAEGEGYFNSRELSAISQAANELAETVERDVIAVQRNLVMESMQEQLASG